jgi:predicted restriction endonuclease
MREYKCKICGWKGSVHLHHIIPLKDDGSEEADNIIELCPNHHSEAFGFEAEFAKEHNLVGKKKSKEELDALKEFSILFGLHTQGYKVNMNRLQELAEKYKFDKIDAISNLMGITRREAKGYANSQSP